MGEGRGGRLWRRLQVRQAAGQEGAVASPSFLLFWTVSVVVVTVIANPSCSFSGRAGHDGSRGRRGGGHEL